MNNCTVRGGGITQRAAWKRLGVLPPGMTGLYQGGWLYEPDSERPYLILAISGHIWKVDPDDPANAVDLSVLFTSYGPSEQVTGQVMVDLQQTSALPAAGLLSAEIPGLPSPVIGVYKSFFVPGTGNTVRVPVLKVYTGTLPTVGVQIPPAAGGGIYDITASEGWVPITPVQSAMTLPADIDKYFFCQAEQFLVIQAGDLTTLPIIWDGVVLRRSLGLSGTGEAPLSQNYGTLEAISSANFTMPAVGGTVVVSLTQNYVGVVGDYLSLVQTSGSSGTGIGATLTNYSYVTANFVVTVIGVNQVTLRNIGINSPLFAGIVISSGVSFWRLFFVNETPWTGASGGAGTPEIPPATAMDYYMGRLWYAQGRQYAAGDIVGSQASGTLPYNFRDSVLKITENPLAVGGDGFRVPDDSGNIRAIRHAANINTQLGEGRLYIFTRSTVYSLTVPVSRTDWIGADNANSPRQEVVQLTNGAVSDRSIVEQNGDLFFQSIEPSIRSMIVALRDFSQWGNTPISINVNRVLKFNNRGLMQYSSGLSFDNRMLQLVLPEDSPVGVIHRAVIPLNFDVVSTLENKLPPTWEGMWQGQAILELLGGDFLGLERCFMPVWSENDRRIELWEITIAERFEGDDARVLWYVEFPAYTWGDEFKLKKLIGAELWFDRIFGEVLFSMDWRPDSTSCWYKWHEWKFCTARNSCEDVNNPECLYPKEYCETYRQMMNLPKPPNYCEPQMARPAHIGYQFQCRLTIKGFCRIRGIMLKAEKVESPVYGRDMIC